MILLSFQTQIIFIVSMICASILEIRVVVTKILRTLECLYQGQKTIAFFEENVFFKFLTVDVVRYLLFIADISARSRFFLAKFNLLVSLSI